ncbi:beta-1,3-galactosyltransferase 2-like [Megalops cyprinoides]|uniref:beta-1,3-galactosyltransferase 2-like n=1 Tax=Megalops cyprinoides TaxID=118141 RepID=UPI0018640B93|nr:beta-1,3-galactosyltransferase 2-like [Megalops cyprinoides]
MLTYVSGDIWSPALRALAWWWQRGAERKASALSSTASPSSPASPPSTTTPAPWKPPGPFEIQYPREYHFILDEPEKCQDHQPFLVLVVPVGPHNRAARDAIRRTWGNESLMPGIVIRRLFLLGLPGGPGTGPGAEQGAGLEEELRRESMEHSDLLQCDFLDSYRNLTIKTMMMLEWLASRCPAAAYAVKVDTDVFLNVQLLVSRLLDPRTAQPRRDYLTGAVIRGGIVRRDKASKWYMPEEVYPGPTYPLYVSGNAYVFSMDLPRKILEASRSVQPVHLEDVYLGMCLQRLGVMPAAPPGPFLLTPVPYERCRFAGTISVSSVSLGELLGYWADFQKAGPPCP